MTVSLVTTRGYAASSVIAAVVRRGYGVYEPGEGGESGGGSSSGTLSTLGLFVPIIGRVTGRR